MSPFRRRGVSSGESASSPEAILPDDHMFAILGVDEGQSPPGFLCVKCLHFWPGPLDSLGGRAGNQCPSTTDSLLAPEVRAEWLPG